MGRYIKPAEIMEKNGISREYFYRKLVGCGFLKRRKVAGSKFGFYYSEDVNKALKIRKEEET